MSGVRGLSGVRGWAAGLALAALAAPGARAQERVVHAEFEIVGPGVAEILSPPDGSARLASHLAAGETARVTLPLATTFPPSPPEVRGTAAARFLGWRAEDARLARLAAALRARPAPLAGAPRVRIGLALALGLGATGAAALWLARRPRIALPLAALASAGAYAAARTALDAGAEPIEVLDGVAGSGDWLRQRAAQGELVLPSRAPTFGLATDPPRAPLHVEAPLDPALPARARAPGAALVARWVEPWPPDALTVERNDLVPLARAWLRAEGGWTYRGRWDLGEPLGNAQAGAGPPGWLVTGLPQGVDLVVGEVEGEARSWLRCTWP